VLGEARRNCQQMSSQGFWLLLTLMNPPSGLALRNAGWALTLGCRSDIDRTFENSGTGPRPGGPCADCGAARRGDLGSFPKTAFNCAVAELG
jgi:hypothetical protein